LNQPPLKPRLTDYAKTDAGNAELFTQLYGDRVRFDRRRRRWLLWGEHHWRTDTDGAIYRMAVEAVRQRYHAATALEDQDERQRQARFAIGSENRQRLEAMLSLAQSQIPISDAGEGWDADGWLLGVANGVIDLRSGNLMPGRPSQRITNFVPVNFDPEASCPRWLRFLDEIFGGDVALIDFIAKAVGHSLTGDISEQCVFICHGSGANGKSVFLSVLRGLAGAYVYNAPFATFELSNRNSIPNDLAALAGARLVTSSETNDGSRLNEARFKALSGGDPITARFLNAEFFTFVPEAKFWLAVNHRPRVEDLSHGFWRRVRLVPFTRTFDADQDKGLPAKLLRELPGILSWAVNGCLAWQREGLDAPPAVISKQPRSTALTPTR
jgi:putative DNA primase/helicase